MIRYGQFCPVAKAAEVFGDRWSPIIMRELCFGTRGFGDLLSAAPLISRTVLAQRLKELADAGVVQIEAKPKGKGHLYRLTRAGEDFRPIVELFSVWGQRGGQGMIETDDFDPGMLVWGDAAADPSCSNTRARLCYPLRFPRHGKIQPEPALLVACDAPRRYRGLPQDPRQECRCGHRGRSRDFQ
jgi:DNA-binding HxlR family transcriptional regulator